MAARQERNRRPAERLNILRDAAKALLTRLDDVALALSTQDGFLWTNAKMKRVVQCFEKRFPEYPSLSEVEKAQGPEDLQLNGKVYCENMEEQYLALYDAVELREEIWKLLTELADDFASPTFGAFPHIAALYLDVFVNYVQICLAVTQIPGREMLACFYAYCYQYATGFTDTHFSRLAKMLNDRCKTRDAALDALRKEMRDKPSEKSLRRVTMVDFLSRVVLGSSRAVPTPDDSQGSVLSAFQSLSAPSLLLEEDLLGLFTKLDTIEYPAGLGSIRDEWWLYQLPLLPSMSTWLSYLFLTCPQLCYTHQRGMEGLAAAMRSEWVSERGSVPLWTHIEMYKVFHDKTYIADFDKEYKDKGGFKKGKADYKEAAEWFRTKAGEQHRARRQYLKERIAKLVNLLTDCPGLLAPQFHLVQAVLAMSRDEVMWYWRHKAAPPREEKKHSKMRVENLGGDDEAVALIAATLSLRRIACKAAPSAALYYASYLADVLAPLIADAAPPARLRSCEGVVAAVVDTCRRGEACDMAGLRLDVERVLLQTLRGHKEAGGEGGEMPVSAGVRALAKLLQKAAVLSGAAEAPAEVLVTASSLHELWWKRADFPEAFSAALRSRPAEALGMVEVYDDFVRAGDRSVPRQLQAIGEEAMREGGERMKEVCLEAVALVRRQQRHLLAPGTAPSADLLASFAELCAFAVKDGAAVRVYRAEFRGGEYLVSALMQDLSVFVRDALWGPGSRGRVALQPLAEAERQVRGYLAALRTMETFSGMPLQDIFGPVHAKLFLDPDRASVGARPAVDTKDGENHGAEARAIGDFFVAMLRGNKAADEAVIAGLRPLARLLGPGGIKVVDVKLLRRCKELVVQVVQTMQSNQTAIKALATKDARRFNSANLQASAAMSSMHDIAPAVCELGSLLDLRRRMHRAVQEAMDTSLLPEGLQLAVSLTGSRLRSEHTAAIDLVAHDCGGADSLWPVDPGLRSALVDDNGPMSESSVGVWEHAVYALSSLPLAPLFSPSDPGRAGYAPHALIALVVLSVTARQHQAGASAADIEGAVKQHVQDLVQCTNAVALPVLLAGDSNKAKRQAASIPKLVAYVEALVQAAEQWTPTVRKRALPDALSRCLHLSQLLSTGPVAHAYDDDDFD